MKLYATVLAVLIVLSGSTTYAQATVTGSTGAGVSGIVDSEISTQVKNVVQTLVGVEATTSGSADADVGATVGTDTGVSSNTNTNVSAELSVITITRADVEEGSAEATQIAATSVRTQAELSGFVASQLVSDENVSRVETSADDVSVTYEQRAHLFGFVPVTVEATATVSADGSIDVSYPWYAFLMTTNEGELEATIEQRVSGSVSAATNASADAAAGFTSTTQAQVIGSIRSAMEAKLEADLAAEASATGTVE